MVAAPRTICREAEAGLHDKGDVVILLRPTPPGSGVTIAVDSRVMTLFGEQIRASVAEEIARCGLTDLQAEVTDQGALDYVIRARTQAAIERAC
ncbi:MAG: citrate lyase subunit gamma [Desulfopila sp.]